MSVTFEDVKHAKPFVKIIGEGKYDNKSIYIDPNTNEMYKVSKLFFQQKN